MAKKSTPQVQTMAKKSTPQVQTKLQAKGWKLKVRADGTIQMWAYCRDLKGKAVKVVIEAVSLTDAYIQQIGSDKYII
jgi:hypothetical protein